MKPLSRKPHHKIGHNLKRMFRHGDLRYIVLHFIALKPSHGYELIKAIEELTHGSYSPSPGSIYPTLTFLEESDLVNFKLDDNKKKFTITRTGTDLLSENQEEVNQILSELSHKGKKINELNEWVGKEELRETANDKRRSIRRSMHALKEELFDLTDAKPKLKNEVAIIIEEAIEKIIKVKKEAKNE